MGVLKLAQLCLSFFVTCEFILDIIKDRIIMYENWKIQLYAILCFLMWIRMYYLMRVYDTLAHFITLI
jgi:hypothetical protein